jgi:hypothetical protein
MFLCGCCWWKQLSVNLSRFPTQSVSNSSSRLWREGQEMSWVGVKAMLSVWGLYPHGDSSPFIAQGSCWNAGGTRERWTLTTLFLVCPPISFCFSCATALVLPLHTWTSPPGPTRWGYVLQPGASSHITETTWLAAWGRCLGLTPSCMRTL